jgi:DNA repair exonuclease SbcCD ATPase subunit
MMMSAADNANCVGHIFHINTPGGSAWAKNDYQQAIDYARAKNQPVVAFVDGMCCSAGMYLAALCDQRYYMHPKDEIGCIGVMAAFYTEKDGSTCTFSNETYHELYDPESFDKNKEFRDIANDGNSELLIQELAKLGVEFRADVKAACPKAKDEHLHGKVFDAAEVKGILMDDQKSLGEVFDVVIDRGIKNGLQSARNAKNMLNPNNNSINMKEKYPSLFAALQVEEMQMQEGGAFMNEELLANLNAAIETAQKEKADALALVDSLKAEHATAIENLNAEHQQAIDQLNEQLTAKGDELAAAQQANADLNEQVTNLTAKNEEQATQIEQLNTELTGAKESLTTAEGQLAEKDQTIADLNAQVEELQTEPGAAPQAGASPENNGAGADAPQVVVNRYVYNNELTYEQNCEAEERWNKEHGL